MGPTLISTRVWSTRKNMLLGLLSQQTWDNSLSHFTFYLHFRSFAGVWGWLLLFICEMQAIIFSYEIGTCKNTTSFIVIWNKYNTGKKSREKSAIDQQARNIVLCSYNWLNLGMFLLVKVDEGEENKNQEYINVKL